MIVLMRWIRVQWLCYITVAIFWTSSLASGDITLTFEDVSGPAGLIPAVVRVSGGEEVTSINVAIGSTLVSGNANSSLLIQSFDPLAPVDSIWSGLPMQSSASPPGLPNKFAKLNNSIGSPDLVAIADGSVLGLVLDASGAQPGDVFDIDLNFGQLSSAASGNDILTSRMMFMGGRVTIEGPQTVPGDFNEDGTLDAADIDALTSAVKQSSNDLKFDLDASGTVDHEDRRVWIEDLKRTFFGDSNLDLQFDSGDFVVVFVAGQYEDVDERNSTWASGDWNGDCEFDSGDFVLAFTSGAYEQGPRAAVAAVSVPEPAGLAPIIVASLVVWYRARKRGSRPNQRVNLI
jgi:hypothetical protein